MTHIKQKNSFWHVKGRGYNTQFLLYPRPLDFINFIFFNSWNGQECRTTSLCQILSKSLEMRSRYRNFILPPLSWILQILNFLTVVLAKKVELRHRAKFRRNRSNRGRDMQVSMLC